MPSNRVTRRAIFVLLLLACVAAASVVVLRSAVGDRPPDDSPQGTPARLPSGPVILYRGLDGYEPESFGKIGYAELGGEPLGRTNAGVSCERVHFGGGRGICLKRTGALRYVARIFDAELRTLHEIDLDGLPSRTRVSSDGRYGAVTAFTRGHSYARPGQFSTETTIIELATGRSIGNLEDFRVSRDGRSFASVDFNFWGVTFAPDSNRFAATLATRGTTYLVSGDIAARQMAVVRENAECPSLSPDGSMIAYKRRVGDGPPVTWRFHVFEVATGADRPLAEPRSIDDQLEWLDGSNLLYGEAEDIWVVRSDGTGKPERFLEGASSPAVVRTQQR